VKLVMHYLHVQSQVLVQCMYMYIYVCMNVCMHACMCIDIAYKTTCDHKTRKNIVLW